MGISKKEKLEGVSEITVHCGKEFTTDESSVIMQPRLFSAY